MAGAAGRQRTGEKTEETPRASGCRIELLLVLLGFLALQTIGVSANPAASADDPFWKWSLNKAVQILNSSAWARQETYTTVVRGVGSGRAGEKEIFTTFYVRFLSATPIRQAYARILQIQHGYDKMGEAEKRRFDDQLKPYLDLDVDRWIVVAVTFRSNDPDQESEIRRFFQSRTTGTMKDKAFLSTGRFPQVTLAAFFPPRDDSVGAKFVFPREIDGEPLVVNAKDDISFELQDVPISRSGSGGGGGDSRDSGGPATEGGNAGSPSLILRATFAAEDMFLDGKPVI